MKKIMLLLITLIGSMSMNAQTIKVYKNGTLQYIFENNANKEYKLVLEEEGSITHDCVDLGLSVKWATMNVGANEVAGSAINDNTGQLDCYGDYFAWANTSPMDYFTSGNIKYYNGWDDEKRQYTYSKYVHSDKYGTADNKNTLELSDDAARANWGGAWRIPTKEEQEELINNCYWKWTNSYNESGVAGFIVYKVKNDSDKGKNSYDSSPTASYSLSDTHIFLPAAGYYDGSSFKEVSASFSYMSNLNYMTTTILALTYHPYDIYMGNNSRVYGLTVRAVCP